MLSVQELEQRKTGIGASDIAAIFGISPYKSRHDLWVEKTSAKIESIDKYIFRRGHYLEQFIANEYCRELEISPLARDEKLYRHPKYPFLITHIDFKHKDFLVEAKTSLFHSEKNGQWGEPGTDEMPRNYLLQCAHELLVYSAATGEEITYVDLAVDTGYGLKIYRYPRNSEIEDLIIKSATEFWDLVTKNIPPDALNYEEVANKYLFSSPTAVIASHECLAALNELKVVKSKLKELSLKESTLKAFIGENLQENEALQDIEGKVLATWKSINVTRFDGSRFKVENPELYLKYTKDTTSRVLLIK